MIPDPLHPAVVHFPIVLAVLTPIAAACAFWAIRSGRLPRLGWSAIILLQLVLVLSTWAATETGEHEEDRVERIVAERHIEHHEEAAERLMALVALGVPLALAGLLAGPMGTLNRGLTIALSLAALGAAGAVGHSGGELVYRHGAAAAYAQQDADAQGSPLAYTEHAHEGEHGDRSEDDDD